MMSDEEKDRYIRKSAKPFWHNYKNWLIEHKGYDFDDLVQDVWWHLLDNKKVLSEKRFPSHVNYYLRDICGLRSKTCKDGRRTLQYQEAV